jgi:hypothetical protein
MNLVDHLLPARRHDRIDFGNSFANPKGLEIQPILLSSGCVALEAERWANRRREDTARARPAQLLPSQPVAFPPADCSLLKQANWDIDSDDVGRWIERVKRIAELETEVLRPTSVVLDEHGDPLVVTTPV